ncbi:MAG: hypothetical protein HY835_04450 [Anaerolineae bacterium]|nr:hypothetical protein [Anaerolineae bacterium]
MKRALILLFCLLLAACGMVPGVGPAPASSPTATTVPTATATQTPTLLPTPTATPTITPTATPEPCRERSGRFQRFKILSADLKKPLEYQIYFPPCYDDSGETRYPVLYMFHGQTYKDDQWPRLGIGKAANAVINAGARPFLIVLPYEVDTFADPYQPGFGTAVVDTLIPWIDSFYPTCTERACRAVGGLSRGGAWAWMLGLDHPELFSRVGGHSFVPFHGMDLRLIRQLRALKDQPLPLLKVDMGTDDIWLPTLKDYLKLAETLKLEYTYQIYKGYHDEKYWSAHVLDYMNWYADGFAEAPETP